MTSFLKAFNLDICIICLLLRKDCELLVMKLNLPVEEAKRSISDTKMSMTTNNNYPLRTPRTNGQ